MIRRLGLLISRRAHGCLSTFMSRRALASSLPTSRGKLESISQWIFAFPLRFLPLAPFWGRGGRGVRGGELSCMPRVQCFVTLSETRQGIESKIKNPIKTQSKTPHPQPLSPKKGRGEQAQKMWVKMRALAHGCPLRPKPKASAIRLIVRSVEKNLGRRDGVTLVELLTVLAVVSLLALLVLPSVKTLLTDRKGTQSATLVRNFLEAARARAVGSGLPVAVVFERLSSRPADINDDGLINDADLTPFPVTTNSRLVSATATDPLPSGSPLDINFLPYNACIRMSMAEQPMPVTNAMLSGTVTIVARAPATWTSGANIPPPDIRNPTLGAADVQARNYFSIAGGVTNKIVQAYFVAGNEVSFNKSSTRHMIIETSLDTSNNVLWFTTISSSGVIATLEQAIPSNEVEGNPPVTMASFTLFSRPRPINGPAVQLPKGTCVDLSISGFSSKGNVVGRDQRMRFSSAWLYATTSAPNASELRPIYVVFTPDGGMSRIYANSLGSALIPVETADDFFLHVGKIDQVVVPVFDNTTAQNLTDPSTYVVRLSPKSGAISVAPATQGIPASADVGSVIELTRQGTYGAPLTGQ